MKSAEIRETFLKFFENYHHQRVKSSSLIPAADPTLLFTNAGMVQFKDCFLGTHDPGYQRATTAQKCVRAGGKHNDLENVGFTPRHHTFFEMLGNFSFGNYFKKDAIAFAWELLTRHLALPKDKLRITVFKDDDEAAELWKGQGVRPDWIERLGEKDNFWAMGDTGPCGPCTEIYFDWGMDYASAGKNGTPGTDSTRYVEIWNLVFMQFNRGADGKLEPLPKPSVDTGSGLERVTAAMQGKYSNYDTDLFTPILADIAKRVGKPYVSGEEGLSTSMRVIADHLRAGTFLMSDGVTPSNEGRGYVLRRILRRAIRHGKKLGQDKPFIHELVPSVTALMGDVYPEIKSNQKIVQVMLREEEEKFHETIDRGIGLLDETIAKLKREKKKVLPGDVAFKLYDTFGFPVDLTEVICRESQLSVDEKGFNELMEKQRSLSTFHKADQAGADAALRKAAEAGKWETRFDGYEGTEGQGKLLYLADQDGKETVTLAEGKDGFAVFDRTPFYAESGGQVGDHGRIKGKGIDAEVGDTVKVAKAFVHRIHVKSGKLQQGASYALAVDPARRHLTAINHTATHLLHAALRNTLGERVKQAGSLVDNTRLRFDFTFPRALTPEEKASVEKQVNDAVRTSASVSKEEMAYDDAIKSGAIAFFDEKYGDRVRVVRVGTKEAPVSVEFCGGTHLDNIGDIGFFKILAESSVSSGVRRIEAITSVKALDYLLERDQQLRAVEGLLKIAGDGLPKRIEALTGENVKLQREVEAMRLKLATGGGGAKGNGGGGPALHDKARTVGDVRLVAETVDGVNPKILRTLVDQVRDKLKEKTVVMLATEADGKAAMCVGVTKDLLARFDAGKLIQPLAKEVGGTGGGRADFAQAGGPDPAGIPRALEAIGRLIKGG